MILKYFISIFLLSQLTLAGEAPHHKLDSIDGQSEQFDYMVTIAGKYINGQEYENALKHFVVFDSLAATLSAEDNDLKLEYFLQKGFFYHRFSHKDSTYIQKAISCFLQITENQELPSHPVVADAHMALADIFFEKEDFASYIRHQITALQLGDEGKYDLFFEAHYIRTGLALHRLGRYPFAIRHFVWAKEYLEKRETSHYKFFRMQELYGNIALGHAALYQFDEAKLYYDTSALYIDSLNWYYTKGKILPIDTIYANDYTKYINICHGVLYSNIGVLHYKEGAYDSAIAYMEKSIAINSQKNEGFTNASSTMAILGMVHYRRDKDFDLENYYKTQIFSRETPTHVTQMAYGFLSEYHKEKGNASSFLHYAQLLREKSNKSRKEEINSHKLIDALVNFELQKNGWILRQAREETIKEQKRSLYLQIAVLIILITLIVMGILLWIRRMNTQKLKKLYTRIQKQYEEITHSNMQLRELVDKNMIVQNIVAHDLRSPLSNISGLTNIFEIDEDSLHKKEYIEKVNAEIVSMNQIIKDLLFLNSSDSDKREENMQPVDMNEVVKRSVSRLWGIASLKEIQIHITRDDKTDKAFVYGDFQLLIRLMDNLLTNAIKFSPKTSDVFIRLYEENQILTLQIEDKGIGIPEQFHEEVFEPFPKFRRAGTEKEPSHGMGLAIIKRIADLHNASLDFQSKEGEGTTFCVSFPKKSISKS